MAQSTVAHIVDYPNKPVAFLKQLLQAVAQPDVLQYMNLATIDEEFGVLNRTVLYRGFSDDECVIYVTQRFTRNYQNLKANAKCAITFLFPQALLPEQGPNPLTWQVRLIGARAVELPESELDAWWAKELLPAQIRASIFPCGKPVDYDQLKTKHDQFLKDHLESGKPLQRPPTFTAFKFPTLRWDFMKVGVNQIADRLQYRQHDDGQWQVMHVST
ncbi:pyridoxine/pyridoxamine 5'-phosphate oxidase [Drosophila grimshawi]|uniref:pyridoxal 5'-phosphate synthase n=1 Tax=Drosophila grimshawi TaxID=7222 RepID=B4JIZ1_DROGR|nr:pyridoxine/pyridoxamine 5'-phosphate oxidase [Drosophila grimshawi]EDV99555.1 GH12411 [Drosophila grimshawi]